MTVLHRSSGKHGRKRTASEKTAAVVGRDWSLIFFPVRHDPLLDQPDDSGRLPEAERRKSPRAPLEPDDGREIGVGPSASIDGNRRGHTSRPKALAEIRSSTDSFSAAQTRGVFQQHFASAARPRILGVNLNLPLLKMLHSCRCGSHGHSASSLSLVTHI